MASPVGGAAGPVDGGHVFGRVGVGRDRVWRHRLAAVVPVCVEAVAWQHVGYEGCGRQGSDSLGGLVAQLGKELAKGVADTVSKAAKEAVTTALSWLRKPGEWWAWWAGSDGTGKNGFQKLPDKFGEWGSWLIKHLPKLPVMPVL